MPAFSSISGIISGLNTDQILQQMQQFKQQPIAQFTQQKTDLTNQLTAWQSINARLLAVKLSSDALASSSNFQTKAAASSNTSSVTATATSSATNGVYTLNVVKLAKAEQLGSDLSYADSNSTELGSGTINITNTSTGQASTVTIPAGGDSLQAITDAINGAGTGVTANIVNVGGATPYRLLLTSSQTGSAGAFTVTTNLSGGAGLSFTGATSVVTPADDAQVQLGSGSTPITLTNPSNTLTNVIPGMTINLLAPTPSAPVTVSVQNDTSNISTQVHNFVSGYNDLVQFMAQQTSYDPTSQTGGPLLGDYALQTMQSDITSYLTRSVTGLSGSVTSLADLGITLQQDGTLAVNDTVLNQQLSTNPQAVAKVFSRSGTTTDPSITFLNATASTKESAGTGYAVNITQVATQTRVTAGTALSGTLAQPEVMSVNGTAVSLDTGMTLSQVVAAVNAQTSSTGVAASATGASGTGTGNYLTLTSLPYGSSPIINAFSNISSSTPGSSGIGALLVSGTAPAGDAGTGTGAQGADVAGTIHGEPATGMGQILTGSSGNATTDGLAILVKSTSPGTKGYVTYSRGSAAAISDTLTSLTDLTTGLVTTQEQGLQSQIDAVNGQITDMTNEVNAEMASIQTEFNNMETQLGQLQSQSQFLTANINAMMNMGSSSSTSSKTGFGG